MFIDVGKLALFAVRIGVDASRAASILRNDNPKQLLAVIGERGAKYASDFIRCACVSRRRAFEHSASAFGNVAVRLIDPPVVRRRGCDHHAPVTGAY